MIDFRQSYGDKGNYAGSTDPWCAGLAWALVRNAESQAPNWTHCVTGSLSDNVPRQFVYPFEKLGSRAQATLTLLFIVLFFWSGEIYSQVIFHSKILPRLLTRPHHVMFFLPLTSSSCEISLNVTTIKWGLYYQGLGILYAQFTVYWNFNFTRSDFCCVFGSPHLLENYETCHISARCFFLFCSQFGLFVSICLMFVCKNNQKTFVVYVNTEHNSNLFHMRVSD